MGNVIIAENESLEKRIKIFLEDKDWGKAKEYCEKCLDINPESANIYLYLLLTDLKCSNKDELLEVEKDFLENEYYKKAIQFSDDTEKQELIDIYNENRYRNASKTLETKKSVSALKNALRTLENLESYKDTSELKEECVQKIKKKKKSNKRVVLITAIVVFVTIMTYCTTYFCLYQNKIDKQEKMRAEIQALEAEKAEAITEFAPVQKILDEKQAKIDSAMADSEKQLIIVSSLETQKELNQQQVDYYSELAVNSAVDSYMNGLSGYSIYSNYSRYDNAINLYKKRVKETQAEIDKERAILTKKGNAVGDAEKAYEETASSYKQQIDKYESTIERADKRINQLNEDIDSIDNQLEKYPYNIIAKILKK